MPEQTLTLELTASEIQTLLEALDWYADDRYECAKHTTDKEDEADQVDAARDAGAIYDRLLAKASEAKIPVC